MESRTSEHSLALPLVSKAEENSQLPLVVNVIAKYWGEELFPASSGASPVDARGSVLIRGIEFAESHGFVSYIYKGSIKDLKKRIDQGIPPIVIVPGLLNVMQHALIVSGYSEDEKRIMTYVAEPDAVGAIPEAKFEDDWNQEERTTIVIVPTDMRDHIDNDGVKFKRSNRLCFESEALRQQNNADGALAKLRMATEIDPDNAQAWCMLGSLYNDLGDRQAAACYESAIKLNPRYYLAHRGLGNYHLKKEDFSKAEAAYSAAIEINPTRLGSIYKNRGIARLRLGNNLGAKSDLLTYLELAPDAPDRSSIAQALSEI